MSERTMSFPEKQDSISKDEWVAKLEEGSYMQKVSMNNLIMNYLVTGTQFLLSWLYFIKRIIV